MRAVQWRVRGVAAVMMAALLLLSGVAVLKYSTSHSLEEIKLQLQMRNLETFDMYVDGVTKKPTDIPTGPDFTLKKSVERIGSNQHNQRLNGSMLDKRGVVGHFLSNITSELVFSFSPETEKRFSEKLVDPNHEQRVYANSPAMIWDGHKFIVVMRMWLDKEHTLKNTKNHFADNYLYTMSYDERMNALDNHGRVLGIPVRELSGIGDGPIEPRAFPFYNQLYLSFNTAVYVDNKEVDTTMFWDWDSDKFVMPQITDGHPQLNTKKSMPRDKHWSPYTYNNTVQMIYSFDPLRIIKCDNSSSCRFTQNAAPADYKFSDIRDCLRGGTPTVHYKHNYYITVTHVTLFKPDWKRVYTINLAVLQADGDSNHKIIYLSEPIHFDKEVMSKPPMVRPEWIEDDFFFPVSLLLENEDSVILGGHINDHSSYLFRIRGIKSLMNEVIHRANDLEQIGPKPGLLHQLARHYTIKQTGYTFQS